MTEFIVEYFMKGGSNPLATRQFAFNEAMARNNAKLEKGSDIIIRSVRKA